MADNSAPDNQAADAAGEKNTESKIEIETTGSSVKISTSGAKQQKNNLQIKKIGGDAQATAEGNVIKVDFENKTRKPKAAAMATEANRPESADSERRQTPPRAPANKQNQPPEEQAENEQEEETEKPPSNKNSMSSAPGFIPSQATAGETENTSGEKQTDEPDNQPSQTNDSEKEGEEGEEGEKEGEEKEKEKQDKEKNEEGAEKNDKGKEEDAEKKKGGEEKENKPNEGPFQKNEKEEEFIASRRFLHEHETVKPKEFTGQRTTAPNEKINGKANKLDENSQKDAASDLNQKRQANRGGKILNFPGQMLNRTKEGAKEGVKDAAENLDPRNIARGIGLDQVRVRNEIKEMEKELRKLIGDKADKILLSKGLGLLSWIMPGAVAQIKGALDFGKNTKSEVKVAMLQAKVLELKALIDLLLGAEIGTSIVDAAILHFKIVRSTVVVFPLGTIAGGALIILSPVIIPILWAWFFLFPGTITKIIDDIVKKIKEILTPLEEKLEKEKKILYLRRRIKQKYAELSQTSLMSVSKNNNKEEGDNENSRQSKQPEAASGQNEQPQSEQKAA